MVYKSEAGDIIQMPEKNYWIVEKVGDKANLSVCSEEEAEFVRESDDYEDWMVAPTTEKSKEDMEELIEENDLEFDPWV